MVHVNVELTPVLSHTPCLAKLQQFVDFHLEFIRAKFLYNSGAEGVPRELMVDLAVRLQPMGSMALDVQPCHPVLPRHSVEGEVGDAAIDPEGQHGAVEPGKIMLGRFGGVLFDRQYVQQRHLLDWGWGHLLARRHAVQDGEVCGEDRWSIINQTHARRRTAVKFP